MKPSDRSRDRSEYDANGWLAESKPPGCWLDDGPAAGYPLPTLTEALLGEVEAHLPLIVVLAVIAATVVAFATGVIVTERLQEGTDASPVPASAPAACVQRADGQRVPAACARRAMT